MAARLAIARAQRQLSMEAGVHLLTRNFSVINQEKCFYNSNRVCFSLVHKVALTLYSFLVVYVHVGWRRITERHARLRPVC